MRLLSMPALKEQKGIDYSKGHLFRLIKAGNFPQPIKLGANRNAWVEAEVDDWIQERIAARGSSVDAAEPAEASERQASRRDSTRR